MLDYSTRQGGPVITNEKHHRSPVNGDFLADDGSGRKRNDIAVPVGSIVLHIGPPKTGTTTLQESFLRTRESLREHGVIYPGREANHYRAIYALMRRADARGLRNLGAIGKPRHQQVPSMAEWQALKDEIADTLSQRVMISHESTARASNKMARQFVDEFGADRIQVVITLRPLTAMLLSLWNEQVKGGYTSDSIDQWLTKWYSESTAPPFPITTRRMLQLGSLVKRWASVAGPDHVTVIVVNRGSRPSLTNTFERILDLPSGLLSSAVAEAPVLNRSMTVIEADVVRSWNLWLARHTNAWWYPYITALRTGVLNRALQRSAADSECLKQQLPTSAAHRVISSANQYARVIARTGVRVIGDLADLSIAKVPSTQATSFSSRDRWRTVRALLLNAALGVSDELLRRVALSTSVRIRACGRRGVVARSVRRHHMERGKLWEMTAAASRRRWVSRQ